MGDYHYEENLILSASYLFEYYDEKNWHYDDLGVDSVNAVLGPSIKSPSYAMHFLLFSGKYMF